jgi:S-DNA-T family DNA segregation ATPase FtsK/SpoIIIE
MAGQLITVSQLKCACLDAAWLVRWLRGEEPPLPAVSEGWNRDPFPEQSATFHRLAIEFSTWLCEQPAESQILETSEALWNSLYEISARGELEALLNTGSLPAAHYLSQALRAFCTRLADLRGRTMHFESWRNLFLTPEFDFQGVPLADGAVLVSGLPDAVRTLPKGAVEVVQYKSSRSEDRRHDLLELAIYGHLLLINKPGLPFCGVLEYYEPELQAIPVSAQELNGIFEEIVAPVIEELAGLATLPDVRLAQQIGAAVVDAELEPTPPPPIDPATLSPEDHLERYIAELGLPGRVMRHREAPHFLRYEIEPSEGKDVSLLATRAADLQATLQLPHLPFIQTAPSGVIIDLPKFQPATVPWQSLPRLDAPLAIPVGIGADGELVTADFAEPRTSHALVAGVAGSGKSEFLKCLAASLIAKHPPSGLRISVIDPKSATFNALKDGPYLHGPVVTDLRGAIVCLDSAVLEMERRYTVLERERVESIHQRATRSDMPFYFLVFDEFADLLLGGKMEREHLENLVARLTLRGSAVGIHLVIATQRPESRIAKGLLEATLPLRICFRVADSAVSRLILGEPGGELLFGHGDLLCQRGRGLERAQAPCISHEELRSLGQISKSSRES